MGRTDFYERLSRIEKEKKRAERDTKGFTYGSWLVAAAMIPVGHFARNLTQTFFEGNFLPGSIDYGLIAGVLIAFHVFLVLGMLVGIFARGRRPVRTLAVLGALIGYGIASLTMQTL